MSREYVRLSLKVSPSVAEAIRELQKRRDTTATDIIRSAVSTEKFLDDARRSGERIVLIAASGQEREVVWRTE